MKNDFEYEWTKKELVGDQEMHQEEDIGLKQETPTTTFLVKKLPVASCQKKFLLVQNHNFLPETTSTRSSSSSTSIMCTPVGWGWGFARSKPISAQAKKGGPGAGRTPFLQRTRGELY